MPRERASADSGYEVVQVCGYCINFLTLTAAGRAQLKLYSIPRLKAYLKAYGIPFPTGALEKDDFVQTILEARESNGCLSADREVYYRRFSVPNSNGSPSGERARSRNIFTRINDAFSPPQSVPTQPRPAQTTGSYGSRPYYTSQPTPRPAGQSSQEQARASPAYQTNAGPQASRSPFHAPSTQSSSQRTTTSPPPRPSSPPVPSLSELLNLTDDELSALSSHTLKEVLHQNHVNARLILEKSDLIDKVKLLIEAERSQRQREEDARRMEEEEAIARQHRLMEELRQRNQMKEVEHATSTTTSEIGDASQPPDPHQDSSPSKDLKPTMLERQGLCVVCQDSEANMAIVDCG
ncbi:hypothetical protein FRC03_001066 [Tulasnella sp. 419]|nr:hypothetical protein FRC02_008609 [Tulasnella sp. 418]KAG8947326.1 hypothetical protein FRC03_001066 [Tulasnella sp. 419]